MHLLSKSRFLSGRQCELKLYFDLFRRDLKPPISEKQQLLFSGGHQIGKLAHSYFPDGKDASPESFYDYSESIQKTKDWIQKGETTIYEAAFEEEKVLCALDILHQNNDERWAIEVKGSTSVKGYYLEDAALQYWVMNKAGCAPDKFFILHVNNKYHLADAFEVSEYFKMKDITRDVLRLQPMVETVVPRLKQMVENKNQPDCTIGPHCHQPFSCDYRHHCWNKIPEPSVFDLYRANGKDWDLYNQGITSLQEIPDNYPLNKRQSLQVKGSRSFLQHIETDFIKNFLDKLSFPLYFLDFETIAPAIPILKGTRPFEQIPFQYSMHIVREDFSVSHNQFLAEHESFIDGVEDPRLILLRQLITELEKNGSIVAYNAQFEKMILKNLAKAFPEFSTDIENLLIRFADLLKVFDSAAYYTSDMGNSASIKNVLPAIDKKFSYEDLPVSNGGEASHLFLRMVLGEIQDNTDEIRRNLLKYCERDTEGMVVIWNHLRTL